MTTALVDVNVLLAVGDVRHENHTAALSWFDRQYQAGWATCPIVENGFLRIFGNPAYPGGPGSVSGALATLRRICDAAGHVFWPDDISLVDAATLSPGKTTIGPGQLTDIYLLALAAKHRGRLSTFDRRIDASFVRGGERALQIIPLD